MTDKTVIQFPVGQDIAPDQLIRAITGSMADLLKQGIKVKMVIGIEAVPADEGEQASAAPAASEQASLPEYFIISSDGSKWLMDADFVAECYAGILERGEYGLGYGVGYMIGAEDIRVYLSDHVEDAARWERSTLLEEYASSEMWDLLYRKDEQGNLYTDQIQVERKTEERK